MKIPILETDRLILRPFCMEEAQEVFDCRETGDLLGTGLIYVDEEYGKFEMAYNLGKKAWGFGYTTEAMQEVVKFAKEELGITEIMGRYAKENPASGKVLKKLGFTYVKDITYECNTGRDLYVSKEYIFKL